MGEAWVDGVCVLLGKVRWKSLKQPVDLKAFMKAAFKSELLGSHKTQAALPAQDLKQCVHMHAHTWTKSHLCVHTSYVQAHMSAHLPLWHKGLLTGSGCTWAHNRDTRVNIHGRAVAPTPHPSRSVSSLWLAVSPTRPTPQASGPPCAAFRLISSVGALFNLH